MKGVSHCEFFIIFRALEQLEIIKLGKTQIEFLAGEKVTFHIQKYFSSEDLDFRNLTKFILHF